MTRLVIKGRPPSVNHMYFTRRTSRGSMRILKPEARRWYEELKLLAEDWSMENGWVIPPPETKVIVKIWYIFKDRNRPDCNNVLKVLLDALEGSIYVNDKFALAQEMDYSYDKESPRIEMEFEVRREALGQTGKREDQKGPANTKRAKKDETVYSEHQGGTRKRISSRKQADG